ncbi:MAG TPA: hypothetical protein VFK05_07060 [Polyangiaceae bacterium]|nr:hypothetical protein [Polyangiaceae bacterium]
MQRVNECSSEAARIVTCVETPDGVFVPVEQPLELCSYRLWFVPRDLARQPLPVSEVLEEFDLAFTVRLEADDLDNDGVVEALLIRGWSHPEGVGDGQEAYVVEPSGEQRRLPFHELKDVDGDGRSDAIVSFASTTNAAGCESPDAFQAWVPRTLYGPEMVLHRLSGFNFSLTDEVSRRARAKICRNSGASVVARRAGEIDEDETVRRAACQLAEGGRSHDDRTRLGRSLLARLRSASRLQEAPPRGLFLAFGPAQHPSDLYRASTLARSPIPSSGRPSTLRANLAASPYSASFNRPDQRK